MKEYFILLKVVSCNYKLLTHQVSVRPKIKKRAATLTLMPGKQIMRYDGHHAWK